VSIHFIESVLKKQEFFITLVIEMDSYTKFSMLCAFELVFEVSNMTFQHNF